MYFNMATNYRALFWKSKATTRNAENKELKKRLKETKQSRDNWKGKYKEAKSDRERYKSELDAIKKKIEKIVSS